MPGPWPRPDTAALSRLAHDRRRRAGRRARPARRPDRVRRARGVLVPESARLRLVVLVHMPFGDVAVAADAECAVLTHARAVVTTSAWTRERLLDRYRLPPERVHVARPGADRGDVAPGTPGGGRLLCVAAVVPHKGHDLLLDALGRIAVARRGAAPSSARSTAIPPFVERLRRQAADSGTADRICFAGPRAGDELRRQYQAADLLVLPSRLEAYGMVVTEALAVGLPVIAAAVGGVPEALGRTVGGLAGPARAARRRGRPRRGARHLAARRRPPGAAAPGGPGTTGDAGPAGTRRRDGWPRCWPRRREPALRCPWRAVMSGERAGVGVGPPLGGAGDPRGPRLAPRRRSVPRRGAADQRLVRCWPPRRSRS